MAGYRKLGRTSNQRKAMIRSQVTALLYHGHIKTTETRAKEIRKVAEGLIALAVKEKDNFETVKVTAKVARKDANGKRVKEVVDGKKVTVYDEVEKEIKKDSASRLHARRQMLKVLYGVTEVPTQAAGKKNGTKSVDLVAKLFDEVAPKYVSRHRFCCCKDPDGKGCKSNITILSVHDHYPAADHLRTRNQLMASKCICTLIE